MGGQNNQQPGLTPVLPAMTTQMPEESPVYLPPTRPWSVPSANPEAIMQGVNSGTQAAVSQVGSAYLSNIAADRADARQALSQKKQLEAQKELYASRAIPFQPFFPTNPQP